MSLPEFRRAVQMGHGRAILHARSTRRKQRLWTAILDATNKFPGYDRQTEERAEFVARLILAANARAFVIDRLKEDFWTESHTLGVIGELLSKGDSRAKGLLDNAIRVAEDPFDIAETLVAACGLEALAPHLELLRSIPESDDTGFNAYYIFSLAAPQNSKHLGRFIRNQVAIRPEFHWLAEVALADIRRMRKIKATPEAPISFAENLSRCPKDQIRWLTWSRLASDDEILEAAKYLQASDLSKNAQLLHIFQWRPWPLDVRPFASKVLRARTYRAKWWGVRIVAKAEGPEPRKIGLELLGAGKLRFAYEILEKHAEPDDIEPIVRSMSLLPKQGHIRHDAMMMIREISERGLLDSRLWNWAFENGPCGLCRTGLIKAAIEQGTISEQVLAECIHDCEEETRRIARRAHKAMRTATK